MPYDVKMCREATRKCHGSSVPEFLSRQGQSAWMKNSPIVFPKNNPLSASGSKVMSSMTKQYGKKKGKNVFYASINKGIKGSKKWEVK